MWGLATETCCLGASGCLVGWGWLGKCHWRECMFSEQNPTLTGQAGCPCHSCPHHHHNHKTTINTIAARKMPHHSVFWTACTALPVLHLPQSLLAAQEAAYCLHCSCWHCTRLSEAWTKQEALVHRPCWHHTWPPPLPLPSSAGAACCGHCLALLLLLRCHKAMPNEAYKKLRA